MFIELEHVVDYLHQSYHWECRIAMVSQTHGKGEYVRTLLVVRRGYFGEVYM
jgi:hypothetical protein